MKKLITFLLLVVIWSEVNVEYQCRFFSSAVTTVQVQPQPQRLTSKELVARIVARYKVDRSLASSVVTFARKYERPTFPTADDIIAIIGIESSFQPTAIAGPEEDPSIGLTQIKPSAWSDKFDAQELSTIEGQVKHGASILAQYHSVLKDRRSAVMAYKLGINGVLQGRTSPQYVQKYERELMLYKPANKLNEKSKRA